MIYNINDYLQNLINPKYSRSALKVALLVGTVLFLLNHGSALWEGKMTKQRWVSGLLSYLVPYSVNIHGQWSNDYSRRKNKASDLNFSRRNSRIS